MFGLSKPVRFALAGILSAVAIGLAAGGANAQDNTAAKGAAAGKPAAGAGPVFIVIDPDRIRRESLAGKSINGEAERYGKGIEDENRKDEAPLRAAEQELQKQRGTLPPDQFAEKSRAFEQRVAEVQRAELKRRQAFERSYNAAVLKWQQAMMDASRDVAAQHNADAVVQSQALLFYNTSWDVTNEIIDLMNKRVAKVDFPPPKVDADAGPPAAAEQGAPPPAKTQGKQLKEQPQPQPQQLKLPAQ